MTLQQLDYIIAVDTHRQFIAAARHCFVTQATLSMMVQKLEEELGVKIFDRSKKPVKPTDIGEKIIMQARRIVAESLRVKELIGEEKGIMGGQLRIGIIPTLAPYLLPLFLKKFTKDHPQVKLLINEYTTTDMVKKLKAGLLDAGILATPLLDPDIKEHVLFYERYYLYVNDKDQSLKKQYITPADIDIDRLWLLDEGHCMRSQILNLCELKKQHEMNEQVHYEAGSIETLKNLVEKNFGMTIIPELATYNLTASQKKRIRHFKPPAPGREISMVTHREFIKDRLTQALKQSVLQSLPAALKQKKKIQVLDI